MASMETRDELHDKKKVIHSFEELEIYKLAREFSKKVNQLIKKLPKEEEYNLKGQMRREKISSFAEDQMDTFPQSKDKNLKPAQCPNDLIT